MIDHSKQEATAALLSFARVSVGLMGSLIGVHWSLAVIAVLLAFTVKTPLRRD